MSTPRITLVCLGVAEVKVLVKRKSWLKAMWSFIAAASDFANMG